jgi:acyl-CoA hydrolase
MLKYLDQLASSTSRRYARGDTVTASVIGVDFFKPIRIGDLLTLRGEIVSTGTTSMVVEMVVTSEDFNTGEIEVTNRAKFVMVHIVDGVPTPVTTLY